MGECMGTCLQHKETPLYIEFPKGGVSVAPTYKNGGLALKAESSKEDGKRKGLGLLAGEHLK